MPASPTARTPCPHPDALRRFLSDPGTAPGAGGIDAHVGGCPGCQAALRQLVADLAGSSDVLLDWPAAPPQERPPEAPDFAPLDRIDAGGMGVVWRVRDLTFGRVLALKVMRADVGPGAADRFLNEARITGRLAHPAVVPVHGTGVLPDGRPYYTMKLVEGETLAARLRGRPAPAAGLPELVRVFAQVCQAVAHAHARGVIHRDLKPANVMVGAFGEVQVMDWGLAREIAEPSEPASPAPRPGADALPTEGVGHTVWDAGRHTRPGAVLGTVAYMAPEQARGEVTRLGPRCDVFALGAILCEVLTGEPPYGFGGTAELLPRAAAGAVAAAVDRLDGCGADPDLVGLAKACLSPDPADRPADAGAVAAAVAAHEAGLAARVRKAEVGRAEAQVWARAERTRRRLATGLAAAVLVGLAGLAAGAALLVSKNRDLVTANGRLDGARAEALTRGEQAARARDRALGALDATTSGVTGESLETQPAITAEQKRFLGEVVAHYRELAAEGGDDPEARERAAAAAHRVGLINHRLGQYEASAQALRQSRDGWEALAAEFPDEIRYRLRRAESCNNLGHLLAELGQGAAAEEAFRRALALRERLAADLPQDAQHRRALAGVCSNLALLLEASPARSDEVLILHRRALDLRVALAAGSPGSASARRDLAASQSNLGAFCERLGRRAEAEVLYRKALDGREKLAAESPGAAECRQDLAASHFNLAGLLRKSDDPGTRAEAEEAARRALAIRERLTADHPAVPKYRQELGDSCHDLGLLLVELRKRPGEVQELYQKALALREALAAEVPSVPAYRRELAATHVSRGNLFRVLDKPAEAEDAYRRALAALYGLSDPRGRRQWAGTQNNLGRLFGARGKRAEAEDAYRKAIEAGEKLAGTDHLAELATAHFNLAELLADLPARGDDAATACRRAKALWEELTRTFPGVPEYRQDLAAACNQLGALLRMRGEPTAAKAAYREALAHGEKLVADFPSRPERAARLAATQVNFGNLLSRDGAFAEAVEWYDKALALLPPPAKGIPAPTDAGAVVRTAHWGRADALDGLERHADALADRDRVVELSAPGERPTARALRARTLALAGRLERAVAEADELAKQPGSPADQLYAVACVYALAADRDDANRDGHARKCLQSLRAAVARGFADADQLTGDGDLKSVRGRDEFRALLAEVDGRRAAARER